MRRCRGKTLVERRMAADWRKRQQKVKLFALGFNKTGTTTISKMAMQWGLKSIHGVPWLKFLDTHDVFSDSDNIIRFRDLHRQFPDAKFVLNTRQEVDWVRSRFKHRPDGWARPISFEKAKRWILDRRNHHASVIAYFARHDPFSKQFLIVDLDDPHWQRNLSRFCGKPFQQEIKKNVTKPKPWLTSNVKQEIEAVCQQIIQWDPTSQVRII